jgi:AcrR family transcriptional regulator
MVTIQAETRSLKRAKKQMYRTHILDVAEQVFAQYGFEGTQVKMVATQAQISLSTLYSGFSNKMDLYRAVHARRLEDLMKRVAQAGAKRRAPLEQMLAGMQVYVGFHMEHPNYLRMHLQEGNAWSQAHGLLSPEQLVNWEVGLKRMAKTFRAGMKSGVFVKGDPFLAARTTNAMHQVALSHWVEDGMGTNPEKIVLQIHRQFIRAFCEPSQMIQILSEYETSK